MEPSKIVCIGLNYHAHVAASFSADKPPDYPLIFLKPPSSIIDPNDKIIHPPQSERVDYEAELGVVIGKRAKNVSEVDAEQYIFGFTCVNDVTARDLQKKDGQWSRAKGFDTFCPIGPWIVTDLNWRDVLGGGDTQRSRNAVRQNVADDIQYSIPYKLYIVGYDFDAGGYHFDRNAVGNCADEVGGCHRSSSGRDRHTCE